MSGLFLDPCFLLMKNYFRNICMHIVFRFWLSLTITCHTHNRCYSSRAIDAELPRTKDRFLERSMHRIVVQGWSFAFLPCSSPLNTIQSRNQGEFEGKLSSTLNHIVYIGHNPHAYTSITQ